MPARGLFVTGTGTGVGKSVVAAAIVAVLNARGTRTAAFKPAVSGLDELTPGWPPDHELLARATGWQSAEDVSPFTFGPPVSPHLAASQTGVTITLEALLAAYEKQVDVSDAIVCEGVGGLMVPLADDPELSVLDFARAIALPAIVATHPGLGTISDTRLTVDRLESEGIQVAAVVISGWPEKPSAIELSNLQTLAELLRVDVATLPITSPDRLAEDAAQLPIERWLHIQK